MCRSTKKKHFSNLHFYWVVVKVVGSRQKICYELHDMCRYAHKNHVSNHPPSQGWNGGQVPKMFFARNCMKCTDLYRKFMFPFPTPPSGIENRNMIFLCRSEHFMQFQTEEIFGCWKPPHPAPTGGGLEIWFFSADLDISCNPYLPSFWVLNPTPGVAVRNNFLCRSAVSCNS